MNSELTWLESIIISRNWRAPELASDDNDDQGEERDTQEPGNCSPYASSTQDFFSARSTASGSSLFNPFDSPPLSSFDNLQDLPQLPHLHFDHPSPADVKSQEQQLIDILSKKVDSTTAVARRIAWKVLFEDTKLSEYMSGWTEQTSNYVPHEPNPKAWVEPVDPPAASVSPYALPDDQPVCRAYLSGTCRNGASCYYKHKLPMDHDSSSRYPADRGYQNRPDSERGTMSSSSGTPSDAHRSPPPAKGWTASPVQQVIGSSAGLNSLSQPAPLPKPDTDFAWTAPPEQSNNNYNYRNDGRPLSPDGWPVKKSEAQLRGNAAPIPDLLSRYVESQPAPPVAATSTGWRSSSSNASKSTTAVAKEIPLPSSEVGDASWSRPTRPGPSPPGSTQPTASSASSQWRASTPKAASPAPIIPIAPVAVAPGAARASSSAHTPPPIHQISQSQADASTGGFDKSLQPDIRVLSGWTVKVPFGQDAHVSAGPPVTATPRHHAQQPPPLARDDKMTREESASTSAGGEAWILSDLNAVKNNDWTSTTRRSRVSKEEQIPTYGRISPYAAVTAGVEDFGDNSIRPSESASNVGGYNDSSSSHPATQREKQTARRPMRQFQGEKDSDLGSNGSSGSLNDNPNARAGGWQRSPTSRDPLEQTLRQSDQQYQGGPQESNYTVPSQAQTSGWIQQPSYNDSKQNSISAPQPRRWDSGSQQLVGDLERAATPRGGYAAPAASVQGRSGSTVGAGRGPGSTISIRGASRYHAESLMLREELDKIRSQVSKYESILSSMDAAQGSGADPELEKENQVLREENRHLRNRVQKLEAEREQLRNALQPVWRLLSAGSKQNGADHLGEMINGHGAQSLQNLSIVDKRESSQAAPLRTVGW